MALRSRPRPHDSEPCPYPLTPIEEITHFDVPTTEEGWKALEKIKKIDLNDLSHKFGLLPNGHWDQKKAAAGMLEWFDTSPTYWVECKNSEIVRLRTLKQFYPKMRDPVIHGLLRRSETMNIIAPPKSAKSWLGLNIAMNVIGKGKLFNRFQCEQGYVLIVDNELHPETICDRSKLVAHACNVPHDWADDHIDYLPLRGRLVDIETLSEKLSHIRQRTYALIILDSLYKFMGDTEENSNSEMALLYTKIDALSDHLDSAIILIHHSSKGFQGNKSVTDMGSGAGSQSRACDAHLVLRDHEDKNTFRVDCANRSFPPIEPFCAKFAFPKWDDAPNASPDDLKGVKKTGPGSMRVGGDKPRQMTTGDKKAEGKRRSIELIMTETLSPKSEGEILANGKIAGLYPWNRFSLHLLIEELLKDGKIKVFAKGAGQIATKYISYSAPPQTESSQPVTPKSSYDGYTADFESKTDDGEFSSEDYENDTNEDAAPF